MSAFDESDPDWLRWEEDVLTGLFPKMERSAMSMSILDGARPNVKFCVELGAAIMFEKPLIVCALPGAHVPDVLRKIAYAVVEVDMATGQGKAELQIILERLIAEMGSEADDDARDSGD